MKQEIKGVFFVDSILQCLPFLVSFSVFQSVSSLDFSHFFATSLPYNPFLGYLVPLTGITTSTVSLFQSFPKNASYIPKAAKDASTVLPDTMNDMLGADELMDQFSSVLGIFSMILALFSQIVDLLTNPTFIMVLGIIVVLYVLSIIKNVMDF